MQSPPRRTFAPCSVRQHHQGAGGLSLTESAVHRAITQPDSCRTLLGLFNQAGQVKLKRSWETRSRAGRTWSGLRAPRLGKSRVGACPAASCSKRLAMSIGADLMSFLFPRGPTVDGQLPGPPVSWVRGSVVEKIS